MVAVASLDAGSANGRPTGDEKAAAINPQARIIGATAVRYCASSDRDRATGSLRDEDDEMVIALFEYRLSADIDKAEWEQTFARMVALASEAPGCISIDGYAAPDGGDLAVVRFESEEALRAWKNHPEHVL